MATHPDTLGSPERLAAIAASDLLDGGASPALDRVVRAAARLLAVPVAQLNVVTADRQIPVSFQGGEAWGRAVGLDRSYCQHVIGSGAPLVVPDAREHPWVRASVATRESGIVAYLSIPIASPRAVAPIATLWVVDFVPRAWTGDEVAALEDLAAWAGSEIELRAGQRRDRLQVEDSLRAAEARLQLALEAAELGDWELDLRTGVAVRHSAHHDRIFGYDEAVAEWSYARFLEHVHPDEHAGVERSFRVALERGEPWDVECRIRRADGAERWIWARGTVQRDDAGTPLRALGIVMDVSERKRTEEALRESESRYRALADLSPDAAWVDLDGHLVYANRAAARTMAAAEPDALLGRAPAEFVEPEHRGPAEERVRRILAGEPGTLLLAMRWRRHDGTVIDVESAAGAIAWEGRPAVQVIFRDVSERRLAEQERDRLVAEVERQRVVLQTVTDNATSALILMEPEGSGVWWNPVWEEMSGWSAEDIRGRVLHDLVHHTRPDGTPYPHEECPLGLALPEGTDLRGHEDVFVRRDGSFFPVVCAARPIWEGGRPVATVLEVRDVTREKAAETALRTAKEEAEEANRAKSDFLSAMSHELRTPLNAIAGYVDLIDAGIHGPVTERQRHALERVKRSQEHLLALINDVLHFARLEAGRLEFAIRDVPVTELLEELTAVIEPRTQARGIAFACSAADSALLVRADPDRVRQVLLNLVDNGVKFTRPGGSVTVRGEGDAERVRIVVADDGRGIPADRLDAVFDPFVQLQRHRNESSQQGVGLGLAISRDLARGMGGDLLVESEEGTGSTFTLVLPRGSAAP